MDWFPRIFQWRLKFFFIYLSHPTWIRNNEVNTLHWPLVIHAQWRPRVKLIRTRRDLRSSSFTRGHPLYFSYLPHYSVLSVTVEASVSAQPGEKLCLAPATKGKLRWLPRPQICICATGQSSFQEGQDTSGWPWNHEVVLAFLGHGNLISIKGEKENILKGVDRCTFSSLLSGTWVNTQHTSGWKSGFGSNSSRLWAG